MDTLSTPVAATALDLFVRGLGVCALWLAARALLHCRRARATARHACAAAAAWALLLLPVLTLALPRVAVPFALLPAPPIADPSDTNPVRIVAPPGGGAVVPLVSPPRASKRASAGASAGAACVLGAAALLLRLFVCLAAAARLLRTGSAPEPGDRIDRLFGAACAAMGLAPGRAAPRLRLGARVGTPVTAARTVLLPPGAEAWEDARLDAVLRHELAHVRRGDWWHLVAAEAACALFFPNPLVWRLAREMRADAEKAADEMVLASGIPASDYAHHLLALAAAA
jgi:Antirepressor regulating drug resistance, predicted signal transduction N-terminal membrane component